MAFSGTRMSRLSRCPSGLTKALTLTSVGMSWAAARNGTTAISAAASETVTLRTRELTRILRASSIGAARAYNGKGGVNEKRGAEAQLLCRCGIRFSDRRARGLPGPTRKPGRHVRTHRPGADVRSGPAVAEALAQSLAARLDHRGVGRRSGPRLGHSTRRGRAARQRKGARAETSHLRMLPHRPADTGVRSGRQPGEVLRRSGPGPRVAGGG